MNFGGTIRINRVGLCIIIGLCIIVFYYLNTESKSPTDDLKGDQGNINLHKLLITAIDVAERGGKEVHDVKRENMKQRSKGTLEGGVNDLLTAADDRSHCVMYYGLKHRFPKLKVVSEEKSEGCSDVQITDSDLSIAQKVIQQPDEYVPVDDIIVWIDPLDATKEYTENQLKYVTTMVCVAVKGKPIIGVIHKPFEETPVTYWAWVGKGYSRELKPAKQVDGEIKITVSISHAGEVRNLSEKAFGKVQILTAAGAGYKVLQVVEGQATAYLHITDIKKWDVCAGNAIINAVEGKMTMLNGQELDYSNEQQLVNKAGLLVTKYKHERFLEQLKTAMSKV